MNQEKIRLDEEVSMSPIWKSKEGGIPMVEMSDEYLQNALIVVQRRQIKHLNLIDLDESLEEQIREEAKKRNLNIIGLETSTNKKKAMYFQSKKVLTSIFKVVEDRRLILLENQKLKDNVIIIQ